MITDTTTEKAIEEVMDQLPYGLYIVGSHAKGGEPNGMMADWVMQVSFKPRLVAVSLENDSHTLENVRADGVFTINFLSQDADGMHVAARFAQPYDGRKIKGRSGAAARGVHRKLDGVPHRASVNDCPILDAAMAWLECEAEDFFSVGDHTIVVGRVTGGRLIREVDVLTSTYTGWTYSG